MATGSWSHLHKGTGNIEHVHPAGVDCDLGVTNERLRPKWIPEGADFRYNSPEPEDEWYISISTRVKGTPWADQLYWKFLDFSKELRPGVLEYVSVTSSKVGEEEDEVEEPAEYHGAETLDKVRTALFEAFGKYEPTREEIFDAINVLQSHGILFRERR